MSNPNPNQFPNQNDFSFSNLLGFGVPNTPGSSSSSPIRNRPPLQLPNYSGYTPQNLLQDFNQQHMFTQFYQQQQFYPQQPFQPPQSQPFQPQQQEQPQEQEQQEAQPSGQRKKRSHKKKEKGVAREPMNKKLWSPSEEVWLAKCWIDASEDSVRGNSQKLGTFWGLIHDKFNNNDSGWVRGDDQLTGKWRHMDKACKDFNAIWNEEDRNPRRSGRNETDIYDRAVETFQTRYVKTWGYKDAWEFLKDKPKWYTPPPVGGSSSRRRIPPVEDEGDDVAENQTIDLSEDRIPPRFNELFGDDPIPRPMGRERARKAARSSASSDAGTSSRGTNSSKMEEFIENINTYKTAYLDKRTQTMDLIAEEERIRSAMEAAKFLAMNDEEIANPRERKRVIKLKKVVVERYKDLLELSDDDE